MLQLLLNLIPLFVVCLLVGVLFCGLMSWV